MRSLPVFVAAIIGVGIVARAESPLSFNRDVRPILSDKCFFCHGPDKKHREADLRLDQPESAHQSVIVRGDSAGSELLARILDEDPDVRMPPPETGKRISEEEFEVLRRWIDSGAEYEPYWAYVDPRPVAPADLPPSTSATSGPIDRFVRSELTKQNLAPASRASRRNQLRRLYLDLTGLPPAFVEIEAFRSDESPDAYERRVDRLLASPAFGERFAEYWLDLVRFADTVGYHGDQDHNISPYRDYVIDSINDGMPLDRFSIEQLAGDLLKEPSSDQLIATGYNRLLQTSHEGGVQPKEYLAIYAADRVRNFSAVWMAATIGCAQCHDHKYDPFEANDFYSLVAFFADIDESQHFKSGTNSLPTRRAPEIDVLNRTDRLRMEDLQSVMSRVEASGNEARLEELRQQEERINARKTRTMITQSIKPRTIRFLPRGNWLDDSGAVMEPAIPSFLGDLHEALGIDSKRRLTRLDLARWLFDHENGIGGLTARVFANRLWYLYMGRGISPTLGDFGGQGRPPTNPDLLDYLATTLVRNQWDIKATVREIVTSETYRQRVTMEGNRLSIDPYNDWCSSQSGHRLPAETVRDAVLEMAGLLDHRIGGRSVKPYQPAGYYRHLNFPTRKYKADSDALQWRRGLYTHWQRQFLHPMLKALDAPSREECTAQRPRSNTPLEALVLLNDPTFVVASQAFAARVLHEVPVDSTNLAIDRIDRAMQIAVGRSADELERAALLQLFQHERDRFAGDSKACGKFLASHNDVPIAWPENVSSEERAAYSSVARAIINLHETLYRP